MTTTTPRIYVACLASYNAGKLHGKWIDADQDADDIEAEIAELLRESPCPNIVKRDHECLDCGHHWSTQVRYQFDGATISGEKPEQCCDCNSKNVASSPQYQSSEEWAIHDYEGFGPWKLSENESIETIASYAKIVGELGDSEAEAFQAWIDNQGSTNYDIDASSFDEFREQYQGCHDSLADYAQQWCEDTGSIPKDLPSWLESNIDWNGVGREFEMGGDIWTHDGTHGVHVFYNS